MSRLEGMINNEGVVQTAVMVLQIPLKSGCSSLIYCTQFNLVLLLPENTLMDFPSMIHNSSMF